MGEKQTESFTRIELKAKWFLLDFEERFEKEQGQNPFDGLSADELEAWKAGFEVGFIYAEAHGSDKTI